LHAESHVEGLAQGAKRAAQPEELAYDGGACLLPEALERSL
jgi:hypothetical protein